MGWRLDVVRRPVMPGLTRSERRSWMRAPMGGLLNECGRDQILEGMAGVS
ncbi:hypothetical protein OG984_00705 [Nocardioides sp. NBC_00368]